MSRKPKLGVWMYTTRCSWIKIFSTRHPLCIWLWHRSTSGCQSYLGSPDGDCKHLNVSNIYLFHVHIPSRFYRTHSCSLLDVQFLAWGTDVVTVVVCVVKRFLLNNNLYVCRWQPRGLEHKLLIFDCVTVDVLAIIASLVCGCVN